MKRFFKRDQGSVSVFLIIIIAPIFFFNAVLIDYARIKIAERETELALKTALRSVMSAYDSDIQTYGLYGMDTDKTSIQDIMETVMRNNLPEGLIDPSYTYTDTRLTSVNAAAAYTLKEHPILKQQILEEMKYRAPIELTLEIIDKFSKSGAANMIGGASDFSKEAKKLDKLMKKRQNYFEKMLKSANNMKSRLDSDVRIYRANFRDIGSETRESLHEKISDLKRQISSASSKLSYTGDAENNNDNIASEIRHLEAEIDYCESLLEKIEETKRMIERLEKELKSKAKEFDGEANKAAILDQEINEKKQQIVQKMNSLNPGSKEDFAGVKVYGEDFFKKLKLHLPAIYGDIPDLYSKFNSSALERFDSVQAREMSALIGELSRATQEYAKLDREKKQAEQTAKKNLIEANQSISKRLLDGCLASDKHYQSLQSYYASYLPGDDWEAEYSSELPDNADDMHEESAGLSDVLLGKLGDSLLDMRDNLYINEYALMKFNYFAFEKEKNFERSAPGGHKLKNQEGEYLLYGFDSCGANLTMAGTELFSARFLLRLTEFLLDPNKSGLKSTPWTLVLSAIAYASSQALSDVHKLLNPKQYPDGVVLMNLPVLKEIRLTYKDYLRLFMLIHGNETKMLARMQSLIHLNTGKDLSKQAAYLSGSAETSVKLWFLPGLIKVLNATGMSDGKLNKDRYEISAAAVYSY